MDRRARVRENQRRSRARKQEYTQELEQKLARHEAAATQNDIQQRITIQQLQVENDKLRHLLYSLGAQPATVNAYLLQNDDPSVSQKVAIPRRIESRSPEGPSCTDNALNSLQPKQPQQDELLKPQSTCQASREDGSKITIIHQTPSDEESTETNRSEPVDDQPSMISPPSSAEPATMSDVPPSEPAKREESTPARASPGVVPDCDCTDKDADSWPESETRYGTTLCADAGELIQQYNTLGVDVADIKKRLWAGCQKEVAVGEGCRVQNQLLFEVLNEISGNLS